MPEDFPKLSLVIGGARSGKSRTAEALAQRASPNPVVIVTNELGMSIVPENALARRFRDDQGRLNQVLGAQADLVLAVIAGLPLVLKGLIPGGPL